MKRIIIAALVLAPGLVFAQSLGNLETLLRSIGRLINIALPIVVAIALLAFFWGLVKFIFAGEEAKKEGQHLMIWGLIALFVMVSVWGLVRWIGNALDVRPESSAPVVPTVPGL
jgi:amino acid permease